MTSSSQINSIDDRDEADTAGLDQPEASGKQISLRLKVILVGFAGLLLVISSMWMLHPYIPPGKSVFPADIPGKQVVRMAGPGTEVRPEATEAAVQQAIDQLTASIGPSKSLPAIGSSGLKSIQANLNRAEAQGSHEAKYLLGLLDYLSGLTVHNTVLQNEGALRIRAAADAGLYLARFDSAVLLQKPYALNNDHYNAARKAAAQGFMPANVDVARYLSDIGKDIEALPVLESLAAWDGTPQSAGGDQLSKFRLSLSGAITTSALKQYAGVSKYLLAMLLVEGKVIRSDLPRAQQLFAESARDGIAAAYVARAKMLLTGQGSPAMPGQAVDHLLELLGLPATENRCTSLFEECGQVHRDAAAYLVALNHFAATPGFEHVRNALGLLQPLADKGNPDAKSLLGMALTEGMETRPDPKKGFLLLTEAADAGVVDAKYWLGRCYLDGKGTKKDPDRALALFTDAAAAGHEDAAKAISTFGKR